MGGDMHVKNRSATASGLVLLFLASTLLAFTPTAAADPNVDEMSWYQAQGLSAMFDPQTEVTTITWSNIDNFDSRVAELLDATYSVYRHEGVSPELPSSPSPLPSVPLTIRCNIRRHHQAFHLQVSLS